MINLNDLNTITPSEKTWSLTTPHKIKMIDYLNHKQWHKIKNKILKDGNLVTFQIGSNKKIYIGRRFILIYLTALNQSRRPKNAS